MKLQTINFDHFNIQPHDALENRAMLLSCGDFSTGHFNTMTIGWGGFGTMWNKPITVVVVRPSRYTYEFMEKYEDFTITAFPLQYKKALNILGTRSGRDVNKLDLTDLTITSSSLIKSPTFIEAELSIECRKIYWQDLVPEHFLDQKIFNSYPNKDYHRVYFGEIVSILGTDQYSKAIFKL